MADKMIILLSQIPFFPSNGGGRRKNAFPIKEMRKERKRGQNHKKGCNGCCILKKMISFMRFMCEKNIFPPNTFPI